jgi:peptidoglycan/LPS O-acetylase OafA/YrhL
MTTLPLFPTESAGFSPAVVAPVLSPPSDGQQARWQQGRGGEEDRLPPAGADRLPKKLNNARYNSLDLWRGAACLMLLLFHATFYSEQTFRVSDPSTWTLAGLPLNLMRKLWVGVPIFFVISGYCIAASIDSLRRRPHSLWDYFLRRVRRIYPPLWIAGLLAAVFCAAVSQIPIVKASCLQLPDLATFSLLTWFGNFSATEAWLPNFGGGEPEYLMHNTWTLCYEEQFYLIAGILLACASRRFFTATAVITAGVFAVRHGLRLVGITQHGFFWDGHWIMFATGILVYHALHYQTARLRRRTVAVLMGGMLFGAVDRLFVGDEIEKHLSEYVFIACGFGLVLIWLRRWDDAICRHWSVAPLRWSGERSYSIYLTHYPLVVVVSSLLAAAGLTSDLSVATIVVPVCFALSLPVAWLFHRTVERRFVNRL